MIKTRQNAPVTCNHTTVADAAKCPCCNHAIFAPVIRPRSKKYARTFAEALAQYRISDRKGKGYIMKGSK
jgi:hypothetical protein